MHANPSSRALASLLASLLPKYHDLPLTLGVLNGACFFPRSEDEILSAGVLQVTEGTTIVVDETVLEEGGLGDQGGFDHNYLAFLCFGCIDGNVVHKVGHQIADFRTS